MVRPAAAQSPPRPSLSGGPPDIRRCRWNEHPGAQSSEAPIAEWAEEFPGRTEKEILAALKNRSQRGALKERRTALSRLRKEEELQLLQVAWEKERLRKREEKAAKKAKGSNSTGSSFENITCGGWLPSEIGPAL